jgi:hypothetical protein
VIHKWKLNLKNDSDEGISEGDGDRIFGTGIFSHDKHGEKWALCVYGGYLWVQEACGVEKDYHMCAKYMKDATLHQEHIRAQFEYQRKVTCSETCLLLQNLFASH